MFKSFYFIAFIIFFTSSCSSKLYDYFKDGPKVAERNDQLMKSFNVDDNVLEKFKQKEDDEIVEEKKVVQKIQKEAMISDQKSSPKKTRIKTQKNSKKKNTRSTKKELKTQEKVYPDDYPAIFVKVDQQSKTFWDTFKPVIYPDEEVYMDINYMGVSTGKIAITTKGKTLIGDEEVYHLNAKVKTARYYRYLYELDDNLDSYVSTEKFIPLKYSLIQRESGQNIDDLQLFDLKDLKTYSFYKRETKTKSRKGQEVKYIPRFFQDPLSVIFFLRGLPHEDGKVYDIPIINKGKLLHLVAHMVGKEKIKTKIGEKQAYKVIASTTYSGDTLKSGDMTFWFSFDERRVFLKFKAEIKIGSISGEIEKYTH